MDNECIQKDGELACREAFGLDVGKYVLQNSQIIRHLSVVVAAPHLALPEDPQNHMNNIHLTGGQENLDDIEEITSGSDTVCSWVSE